MSKIRNILQILGIFLIASCNREEVTENGELPSDDKIAVNTEISVDGVDITGTDTRASSEAGYTTGDGLYDKGDPATVAAYANSGYELVSFYDKKSPSVNLGSSHTFRVTVPQTFKAEFRKVANYTITVTASPSAGGSVTGGGSYKGGSSCTVKATPNSGYTFAGWYENGTRVSADASYSFTVSSNRTLTSTFVKSVGVYYFSSSNEEYGTVSQSVAYIEDWRDLDEQSGAIIVNTTAKSGYYFNSWIVKTPDSNTYEEVTEWWADDRGTLNLNNGQVVNEYPSGSDFKAVFSASPTRPTYTVTIRLAEWTNGSWKNSQPLQYGVAWEKENAMGSIGTITVTKKFKAGDICTFWLAASCDSYGCYEPQSVTTVSHNLIDNIYGKYTYSFEVKSDIEYYVDVTYIRND